MSEENKETASAADVGGFIAATLFLAALAGFTGFMFGDTRGWREGYDRGRASMEWCPAALDEAREELREERWGE